MSKKKKGFRLTIRERSVGFTGKNSKADLNNNEHTIQFKQQLKELKKQYSVHGDRGANGTEGAGEDMTVTKSQANFFCPRTHSWKRKILCSYL